MSYEPTEWKTGDVVTSAKLNKLENGVASSGGKPYRFVRKYIAQNVSVKDSVFFPIQNYIEGETINVEYDGVLYDGIDGNYENGFYYTFKYGDNPPTGNVQLYFKKDNGNYTEASLQIGLIEDNDTHTITIYTETLVVADEFEQVVYMISNNASYYLESEFENND